MKSWEYCKLYKDENEDWFAAQLGVKRHTPILAATAVGYALAQLGIDGWELVTVDKNDVYILKREKQS